tara:strand:- start:655 stop:1077 length:423 start_codon:yes stop_codon:yes gene_type:complete
MAKKKKVRTRDKANAFLNKIGTAGGVVGQSEQLLTFGAGDTARQVQAGNTDNYIGIRAPAGMDMGAKMPQDLDSSYLKLNLPGSPLPRLGLFTNAQLGEATMIQDNRLVFEQMQLMQNMPPTANYQLPMGIVPPKPAKRR